MTYLTRRATVEIGTKDSKNNFQWSTQIKVAIWFGFSQLLTQTNFHGFTSAREKVV